MAFYTYCCFFKIIFTMKKGYVSVWGRVSFVGMLFLVFEKSDEQKNSARIFQICKYAF